MIVNAEDAEIIALKALAWLMTHEDQLGNFLGTTGLSVADLKQRAGTAEVLVAVLDFIAMDDEWMVDCARYLVVSPDQLALARETLPGGSSPHWT